MFGLLTGRYLFKGEDKRELLYKNKVCNLSYIDSILNDFSPSCKDLVLKML